MIGITSAIPVFRILSCRHCHAEIGRYTPGVLHLGTVTITERFQGHCKQCSGHVRWRPISEEEERRSRKPQEASADSIC